MEIIKLPESVNSEVEDLNLDRQMRKLFYNKMSKPSIGDIIAEHVDNNVANEIASKVVSGLFSTGKSSGGEGFWNSAMAMKLGEGVGQNLPAIIQTLGNILGKERAGRVADAVMDMASGRTDNTQRGVEEFVSKLNPDDINDLQKFIELLKINPQNPQISDLNQAKQILINEQNRIREASGVSNQPRDMNRQLMNQYENQPTHPQNSRENGTFFSNQPQNVPPQNNDEFVMSLNPDDPVSQQQYMAFKKISGVPLNEVKRFMIKEQNALRSKLEPVNDDQFKWNDLDEVKVMKKEDFYEEINYKQPPKPEGNPLLNEQPEMSPNQAVQNPMDTILRILEKLNTKVEQLNAEVVKLKSEKGSEIKDVVLTDTPTKNDNIIPEEISPKTEEIPPETTLVTNGDNKISDVIEEHKEQSPEITKSEEIPPEENKEQPSEENKEYKFTIKRKGSE